MKNCASDVHKEILSQEFMGVMKSVITSSRVCVCVWVGGNIAFGSVN